MFNHGIDPKGWTRKTSPDGPWYPGLGAWLFAEAAPGASRWETGGPVSPPGWREEKQSDDLWEKKPESPLCGCDGGARNLEVMYWTKNKYCHSEQTLLWYIFSLWFLVIFRDSRILPIWPCALGAGVRGITFCGMGRGRTLVWPKEKCLVDRNIFYEDDNRETWIHTLLVCSVSIRSDFYEVKVYLKFKNIEHALEFKKIYVTEHRKLNPPSQSPLQGLGLVLRTDLFAYVNTCGREKS